MDNEEVSVSVIKRSEKKDSCELAFAGMTFHVTFRLQLLPRRLGSSAASPMSVSFPHTMYSHVISKASLSG